MSEPGVVWPKGQGPGDWPTPGACGRGHLRWTRPWRGGCLPLDWLSSASAASTRRRAGEKERALKVKKKNTKQTKKSRWSSGRSLALGSGIPGSSHVCARSTLSN